MRSFVIAAVLLGPALSGAVAQQSVLPSVPQTLRLEEAVELATRNNPSYRQVINDRGAAVWGVRNAYSALFLPSLNASTSLYYRGAGSQQILQQEFVQTSSSVGSGYQLGLSWQLSGATLSQPGLAKAQLRATDAAIDGAAISLRAAVTQQYLAVLQAQEQVTLAQSQLTRNDEFLRLAQARFQVGQATMLDVRQAEVAKGQAEVSLLQARQGVIVEKLRLFQQIGVPAPDDPNVVSLPDTFPVVEPTWTLADLLNSAEQGNPDVGALRAQAAAARSSEHAAKSQWLPTLNFSAGWSGYTQRYTNGDPNFLLANARAAAASGLAQCEYLNDNLLNPGGTPVDCSTYQVTQAQEQAILDANTKFPFKFSSQPFSASVSLSLPIFTQFGRPARIAEAAQQADDAQERVEARRLQVRTDVSQAYYGIQAAYQAIGIQATNKVAAQEQLRLATERYRVGSGTFFELLDAQLAAQRADADYITAVYAYHRQVALLEAAVGRPLR
jgi:outer membrane protein